MAQLSREQLIELVTREVFRVLGEPEPPEPDPGSLPKALAVGDAGGLPALIYKKYRFLGMESYTCPEAVSQYEAVFITSLSLTELADIALGRDTRAVQCAVISALMEGVPVYLSESALTWRKKKNKMAPGFYQMLEGYVRTLQNFGVRLLDGKTAVDKDGGRTSPLSGLPDGLVTEDMARALVAKSPEPVILIRRGTVLTPSARDVFLHAGKEIRIV